LREREAIGGLFPRDEGCVLFLGIKPNVIWKKARI
jgi:hypothetical protein